MKWPEFCFLGSHVVFSDVFSYKFMLNIEFHQTQSLHRFRLCIFIGEIRFLF